MGTKTLKQISIPTIAVVFIITAIMLVPSLLQTGEALFESINLQLPAAGQHTIVNLKPGHTTGSVSAGEIAGGISNKNAIYAINVASDGDGGCKHVNLSFRMSGYMPERGTANCSEESIETTFRELFNRMIERFKESTTEQQIQIEKQLFEKFIKELPRILNVLR